MMVFEILSKAGSYTRTRTKAALILSKVRVLFKNIPSLSSEEYVKIEQYINLEYVKNAGNNNSPLEIIRIAELIFQFKDELSGVLKIYYGHIAKFISGKTPDEQRDCLNINIA